MSENSENKKPEGITENTHQISDEETGGVSGGSVGGSGYYMTVSDCNGSYLALRPEPYWDQYNELARLWPGYQVFTYGATTEGTSLNGIPCIYTYVNYNGIWGWANSAFLRG